MTSSDPGLRYEPNPKHEEPWQRGRRGSLCPSELSISTQDLLEASELVGRTRYACLDGRPYAAREHEAGVRHGYPVGWKEVPATLRQQWLDDGRTNRRLIRRHWEG